MEYTILILILPLLSFLCLGLLGTKLRPFVSGCIGSIVLAAVAAMSYTVAAQYFSTARVDGIYQPWTVFNVEWLGFTQNLHIDLGILLDPISVMMLVVISTVSLMVHIYSLGYMKGEVGFQRYYAFLSLFTFSMLGLVVATNIFQMYIFWELVGVSSYLLIGFYYTKPEAIAASKKAFIVTRFADMFFLIGILLLSYFTQTFNFGEITSSAAGNGSIFAGAAGKTFMGCSVMAWAMALIFIGGAGKSAMFPLHIWLPDAMEGPTPVSALIHAATMVVAGVYLVARLFPVYYFQTPEVLVGIAVVGAFTSLFAAVIACVQTDIKRVLAFSTISQIGFMMVALGVSGYGGHHGLGYMAGMFHLFTHAQGAAVPRCRCDHPCRTQQRNEPHGRPAQTASHYAHHLPDRLPRDCGYSALLGLLQQGRNPLCSVHVQSCDGLGDDLHRCADGLLYVPSLLSYFLGHSFGARAYAA